MGSESIFKNVCFNRENEESQGCRERVIVERQAQLDQRSALATTELFKRQSTTIITDY